MKKQLFFILMVCCLTVFTVKAQQITAFKFSAEAMGWDADEEDFEGAIDDENLTITFTTQRWIENIAHLAAIFEVEDADDCEVKVGEDVQTSGETENDFRKDVVYTLCGDVHYTVHFVSPQATGLPVIKIVTQDSVEVMSKEDWTNMTSFVLIDSNDEHNNISLGPYNSSQYHRIRGRGNSTWSYPKKPYRIRFREDVSLFGNAAYENWVLLADYLDPTFLMTAIAFELGESVFQLPFTCTYRNVHLYYNGRYDGLYTLTEHRQADPNGTTGAPGRVGIDQDDGGWFIEIDDYFDEDPKFRTVNYDLPVMIKAPEYASDPTDSDNPFYDFVKNDLNELCDSMASPAFPENGYRDFIDMNTVVDFLMINEVVSNHELRFPKSTFAYKADKDGKISMGPLWDFDWAFSFLGVRPDIDRGHTYFTGFIGRLLKHDFFFRFFEDPVFAAMYKERWNEKYGELVTIHDFIENLGAKVNPAAIEDAKRWVFPGGYRPDYDPDHAKQTDNMLRWWKNRVSWLHTEINRAEVVPRSRDFGSVTKEYDYSGISTQKFTIVTYGAANSVSVRLSKGTSSAFVIMTPNVQFVATDNGGFLGSVVVQLKRNLQLGVYEDELNIRGVNQGVSFSLTVPLKFAVTKLEQELFLLDEVENKETGDENFFLTTTGGSGNGTVTFTLISGNAIIDENTGEVEITEAGDIVVVATKAEDEDFLQAQSQELIITVNNPTGVAKMTNNLLQAWIHNSLLHVTGIIPGETLSVYSITGSLVYRRIATSNEMDIPLRAKGVYIVRSGNNTVKVVNYE